MKLLKMKCREAKHNAELVGEAHYFIRLESKKEFKEYEKFYNVYYGAGISSESQAYFEGYWDSYMTSKLRVSVCHGEIYDYFAPIQRNIPEEPGDIYESQKDSEKWELLEILGGRRNA